MFQRSSRRGGGYRAYQRRSRQRRGVIVVLAALLMVFLVCMLAFAIDVGYLTHTRSELRRAVDAAALAGAGGLSEGEEVARQQVRRLLAVNPVSGRSLATEEIEIQLGVWDDARRQFTAQPERPSAVHVSATRRGTPLFFARIMGTDQLDLQLNAVAMYEPRDIVLVLDYSASMSFDSQLKAIPLLGREPVLENLYEIYEDLGSPEYGNLQWEPVSIRGNVAQVLVELGLDQEPYPYPAGSWAEYIQSVMWCPEVRAAGYWSRFGYVTLLNYWLKYRPLHTDTPDLWQTRAQPLYSLKNAVSAFVDFLQVPGVDDRLGLVIYTAEDGTAILEQGLTNDFDRIDQIARDRQAGHYHAETNIGDAIRLAREELLENGRPGANQLIVLMTDGEANRPHRNESLDKEFTLQETRRTANTPIRMMTISLGVLADVVLMEQVAQLCNGVHFNVPGGRPLSEVERDLIAAFEEIAHYRPLKLVQ